MRSLLARFAQDQSGATAVEYCVLASLTAVFLFSAFTTLGVGLKDAFNNFGNLAK